jgi:hypothetical protein
MNEHAIKLAEHFGLSRKEPEMSRRSFLKGLVATGAIVAAPGGLWMPREPKIFQVGGVVSEFPHLRDENGNPIHIRDFRESDKFDTFQIPKYATQFTWKAAGPMAGLSMVALGMMYAAMKDSK